MKWQGHCTGTENENTPQGRRGNIWFMKETSHVGVKMLNYTALKAFLWSFLWHQRTGHEGQWMREKAKGRWLSEVCGAILQLGHWQSPSPHRWQVPGVPGPCRGELREQVPALLPATPLPPCSVVLCHGTGSLRAAPVSGSVPWEEPRKQNCSNQGQDVQRTWMKMKLPQPTIISWIANCNIRTWKWLQTPETTGNLIQLTFALLFLCGYFQAYMVKGSLKIYQLMGVLDIDILWLLSALTNTFKL